MHSVRGYLQTKGHDVWSTRPDATVFEALELMAARDIGALLVMENERLVGIFSERDYARKVILHGKTARETLVKEIMTSNVVYIRPEQTIEECMALISARSRQSRNVWR